ncbi:hypothetical protein ONZ43_g1134 [Nemania bipapillata]|uniref:Uncharacterized protein n=1 Tax=Nemania bipapillata TaxID=110536 RepID=A0ACC2J5H6_9PEZI|nr:hypothetical protein ONZ43_g1134 [Nemania bipapillata]
MSLLSSSSAKSIVRPSSVADKTQLGKPIGDGSGFEPCSVIDISSSQITSDFLRRTLSRFARSDDVWAPDFLNCVIFQNVSEEIQIADEAMFYLKHRGATQIYTIPSDSSLERCPEGPYFLNAGALLYAYRLYPDLNGAFVAATVEGDEPYSHASLDASAYGELYPSALTIAVPSRLRFRPSTDTPLAGVRIAVKDIMDLKGMKTGASSRAYTELYGPRRENAAVIQTLLELGAVVVGKTKTTQFADSEWATCDWVDYHAPFNPRGDGYLTPSGSSSGSAAAIASYDWLDLTMGSTRAPAAAQGIYGMRPSLGAGSYEGIIPYSPLFDTPGSFARDAVSLATLAKAIYRSKAKSRRILYPTDFWPVTHTPSQALFDSFVKKLESFLVIERNELNLEQLWANTNPEGTQESLSDFLEHAFEWAAHRDQWTGFFKDFLQEYENKYQKAAILNPQLRFKR